MIEVIAKRLRTATVDLFQSETYDDYGKLQQVFATGVSKRLAIFPLTFKDLQFESEGGYNRQDKKFYEIGEPSINQKSIVYFEDEKYLVDQVSNRLFDGGFSMYIGKKIDDTGQQD